jgi:hypothetical protein
MPGVMRKPQRKSILSHLISTLLGGGLEDVCVVERKDLADLVHFPDHRAIGIHFSCSADVPLIPIGS